MQPVTPSSPIKSSTPIPTPPTPGADVMPPAAPAASPKAPDSPLPVRPAPTEGVAEALPPLAEQPEPKKPAPLKQPGHELPTGVITITILTMIVLCALTIWVYAQSSHS